MSFILNPYINFRKGTPSFAGYNITRYFGLIKLDIATINHPIKIKDLYNDLDLYVFFNNKGIIDTNSKVSTTTTPTATTLADVMVNNSNIPIISLFCLVSGIEVEESFLSGAGSVAAFLVRGGNIAKKNNKPVIDFPDGYAGFIANPISEFNNNNSVVYNAQRVEMGNSNTNNFGYVVSTNPSSFQGFSFRHYRTGSSTIISWRNTSNVAYPLDSTGHLVDTVTMGYTHDKNNEHILYKNGSAVTSSSVSGNLVNNTNLIIGRGYPQPNGFTGLLSLLIITNSVLTPIQIAEITTKTEEIFGT